MDKRRKALEQEVKEHEARIAKVRESLRAIEDKLGEVPNSAHLVREVEALRVELHGRSAAVAVGTARLSLDLP